MQNGSPAMLSSPLGERRLPLAFLRKRKGPSTEPVGLETRLAAMDALRGGAMLLGVFIHAAISYMPTNLADLYWGIRENQTSAVLDAMFWCVHACRLPMFFLIAGFFAALVFETKGAYGFAQHRLKRLILPYAAGLVCILPSAYLYAWACGLIAGQVQDPAIEHFELAPGTLTDLWGPMHLWFLQDLLILSAVFLGWRLIWRRGIPPADHGTRSLSATSGLSFLAPLALALPTILLLYHDTRPLIAHRNTFVPDGARLLHYGYFFAVGTFIYRFRGKLAEVFAWPLTHLTLVLPAAAVMLSLIPGQLRGNLDESERLLLAAAAGWLAWLALFGIVGLALKVFQGRHPAANYLADASYWLYLSHLPIVCMLQLTLNGVDWLPEVKCALVLGITTLLGLASYQVLVRHTAIGAVLHGPRQRTRYAVP